MRQKQCFEDAQPPYIEFQIFTVGSRRREASIACGMDQSSFGSKEQTKLISRYTSRYTFEGLTKSNE